MNSIPNNLAYKAIQVTSINLKIQSRYDVLKTYLYFAPQTRVVRNELPNEAFSG